MSEIIGMMDMPEDLDFGDSIPETGVFSPRTYVNPKGELTLKIVDFKLNEHPTYGTTLRVFFEVMSAGEYEGMQTSFTIWPSKSSNKIELSYGGKATNLAKLALALMNGVKVEDGKALNLRALVDAGAMCRGYILEGKPDAQGRVFPKLNWDSLEPVKQAKTGKR